MSHPTWVCGLKRTKAQNEAAGGVSHPTWVCGLKPRPSKELTI